ncbi:hypothetical protein BBF96_11815 [Anoxybacter fermentans]|uniref:LysM domain-containing protein n=1 Tax=Anoxybacter fermentans TaxID=1323375 RepID=A0A3Q9HRB8_9FIRM|nr:M23 family metallopeptidase [Anoxybacter fermentans]AZR74019.1 hypothetical protein BBF96_11815 [Anoxybacter fermentans]
MVIPFVLKRWVVIGVLILFLILGFTIARSDSESVIKPEEIQIHLTEDILTNPLLEKQEIWKANQTAIFTAEQDWNRNDLLNGGSESIELFMKNIFKVVEESSVILNSVDFPKPTIRPENLLVDVKSPRENTLLKAAGKKVSIHIVQPGETLWDISRMYGIDIDTIIGANQHIENIKRLKAGQELKILNCKGVIHKVSPYETLSDISRLYGVEVKKIMEYNNLKSARLSIGDTLIIPGASPVKLEFRGGFSTGFIWPVRAPISSPFGMRWGKFHYGIDLAVPTGTPIKAAKSGKVIYSGEASGYGLAVYIKHDDKTVTRYGHNSKLLVKKNDFVYQGQVIALSGNTGFSTAPHLHFEIRINGKAVNPLKYLKK